jgi:proteasome lid subunit RPN8/RPN11
MLKISDQMLLQIHANGEKSYPHEGAGLLLGRMDGDDKMVKRLLVFANAREESARHNRYLLTPENYLEGERQAMKLGLDVIGVFHSHPDHPNRPSDFDREWAMPYLSYIITSIQNGKAISSRSWLLRDDRSQFDEERILQTEDIEPPSNIGSK